MVNPIANTATVQTTSQRYEHGQYNSPAVWPRASETRLPDFKTPAIPYSRVEYRLP
jgi:hypothetical protein